MKFKTKIVQSGNNTGIHVPDEIIERIGAGKKPPVVITLKKYTYRNTVAVMGGKYMVSLSAEHRTNAHVSGGEELEINIELDTEPRTVDIPQDLQKALNKNVVAKKNFEALSPSKKKYLVLDITSAKTEETKIRRIEKAIQSLPAGKV